MLELLSKETKQKTIDAIVMKRGVFMKYNLVVAGGGLSGVAAAIAHKTAANAHTVDIKALQQKLKDNGAVL